MRATTSDPLATTQLDEFYEELAETAEDECFRLPSYSTCLVRQQSSPRHKLFRSKIILPGLRLQATDGRKYFIPEAILTGTAEQRQEAENSAAREACSYLKNFIQRSELVAADWTIDNYNELYQQLTQMHGAQSTAQDETEQPPEGHHLLVIASLAPRTQRNRQEQRQISPSSSSTPRTRVSTGSRLSSDGGRLTHLSNEVHQLKEQIDRLNALVERHHQPPAPTSITQPASTSYQTEVPPA